MDTRKAIIADGVRSVTPIELPAKFLWKGINLYGFLHIPAESTWWKKRVGIIMLAGGLINRAGSHRILVRAARKFCYEGFYVLRFDFPGIGDSEGEITNPANDTTIVNLDCPNFEETLSAIDFFDNRFNLEKIVLFGHCSGARTALVTGSLDKRIDSMILLSMPALSHSAHLNFSLAFQNPFGLNNWQRYLLHLKNYKYVKTLPSRIIKHFSFKRDSVVSVDNTFKNSFQSCMNLRKRILLIYGSADAPLKEFELFANHELKYGNRYGKGYTLEVIEGADHGFRSVEWSHEIINRSLTWLKKTYPYVSGPTGHQV